MLQLLMLDKDFAALTACGPDAVTEFSMPVRNVTGVTSTTSTSLVLETQMLVAPIVLFQFAVMALLIPTEVTSMLLGPQMVENNANLLSPLFVEQTALGCAEMDNLIPTSHATMDLSILLPQMLLADPGILSHLADHHLVVMALLMLVKIATLPVSKLFSASVIAPSAAEIDSLMLTRLAIMVTPPNFLLESMTATATADQTLVV